MSTRKIITEADYLAELEATINAKPPTGAFMLHEQARKMNMSRHTLNRALLEDVEIGRLNTAVFRNRGKMCRYFWIAKPSARAPKGKEHATACR